MKTQSLVPEVITTPVYIGDLQFAEHLYLKIGPNFRGTHAVIMGQEIWQPAPAERPNFSYLHNVTIEGDPRQGVGGILSNRLSCGGIHKCRVFNCGGIGIEYVDLWNCFISDTVSINNGWLNAYNAKIIGSAFDRAAGLYCWSKVDGNEGSNDLHVSNSIFERNAKQVYMRKHRGFELGTSKLHNTPPIDPAKPQTLNKLEQQSNNYGTPAMYFEDCTGEFALGNKSNLLSWVYPAPAYQIVGGTRLDGSKFRTPVIQAAFAQAQWAKDEKVSQE